MVVVCYLESKNKIVFTNQIIVLYTFDVYKKYDKYYILEKSNIIICFKRIFVLLITSFIRKEKPWENS